MTLSIGEDKMTGRGCNREVTKRKAHPIAYQKGMGGGLEHRKPLDWKSSAFPLRRITEKRNPRNSVMLI
jgi:hypothetical protein